jgi:hypothetical protein
LSPRRKFCPNRLRIFSSIQSPVLKYLENMSTRVANNWVRYWERPVKVEMEEIIVT